MRHGLHGFDAALKQLSSLLGITEVLACLTVIIETFGIVGPVLNKSMQRVVRLWVHGSRQVRQSNVTPDFVMTVLFVLFNYQRELIQSFLQAVLHARDTAELIMRVSLARVDLSRAFESFDSFVKLMPALED